MTVDLPLDGVGTSVERLEDVRQVGGRDPRTVVADGDPHFVLTPFAHSLRTYADPSVPSAVLDGIGNEVLHGRSESQNCCAVVGTPPPVGSLESALASGSMTSVWNSW